MVKEEDEGEKNEKGEKDQMRTSTTRRNIMKKRRKKWSNLELDTLEKGMMEHGTKWRKILDVYGRPHGHLRERTPVQLKDKARTEKMRRIREGISLGIFEIATE
ncbi:10279_t:CDS:1 [Diversispora eburnea]|uniref:10279_t:CDS:1 n=1 Tax=Diversispora eburnea TaxID=1213867 RepID=A0A9N9A579_9GLOM|nr:10279_t:CDS:1 [Diversispora eburnea]